MILNMIEQARLLQDSPNDKDSMMEAGARDSEIDMNSPIEETQLEMNTEAQPAGVRRQLGAPFYYLFNIMWSTWQLILGGPSININNRQSEAYRCIMDGTNSLEADSLRDSEVVLEIPDEETRRNMIPELIPETENGTKALKKAEQKWVERYKNTRDLAFFAKMMVQSSEKLTPPVKLYLVHGAGHLHFAGML